jgi:mannose-6-phosphate isomerase-like protein (cupin superfamily)
VRRIAEAAADDRDDGPSFADWQSTLTRLATDLRRPMPLPETERIESVLKECLRAVFRKQLSDDDAGFLAEWQRDLGFLLKYKSYGVKCATPFGYSVFLQNPGEGFSFQRHLTHKTEVFHILEPLEGAVVFLCDSEEWDAVFDPERFQRWLAGSPNKDFDCFATRPQPGDVYHVSELGMIHSVLGCVLEEFATVSTDMVDRLHDQNAGRHEPHPSRDVIVNRLRSLAGCAPRIAPSNAEDVGAIIHKGDAQIYRLASGAMDATRVHMNHARVELQAHPTRVQVLFAVTGSASCVIRSRRNASDVPPPPIEIRGGDPLTIAPGFDVIITAPEMAAISIHAIEPEVALV